VAGLPRDAGGGADPAIDERGELPAGRVLAELTAVRCPGVRVNGLLGEWGEAEVARIDAATVAVTGGENRGVDAPPDLAAELGLMWDDRAIYLAARVVDDDRTLGRGADLEWYRNDAVALMLDLGVDRQGSAWLDGDAIFAFRADPDQGAAARWWRRGP